MIDEKTAELLINRLVKRIDQANTYFLMQLGQKVKQTTDAILYKIPIK